MHSIIERIVELAKNGGRKRETTPNIFSATATFVSTRTKKRH